jgi:hypothetical protein
VTELRGCKRFTQATFLFFFITDSATGGRAAHEPSQGQYNFSPRPGHRVGNARDVALHCRGSASPSRRKKNPRLKDQPA